jgi:hypothetical protein
MIKMSFSRAVTAALLAATLGAASPALAKNHHPKPSVLPPDPQTLPFGMNPPPDTLYPRPRPNVRTPMPSVRSQVPVGRAQPGVTPYELLPNRP